jgi:hypothetical protein
MCVDRVLIRFLPCSDNYVSLILPFGQLSNPDVDDRSLKIKDFLEA